MPEAEEQPHAARVVDFGPAFAGECELAAAAAPARPAAAAIHRRPGTAAARRRRGRRPPGAAAAVAGAAARSGRGAAAGAASAAPTRTAPAIASASAAMSAGTRPDSARTWSGSMRCMPVLDRSGWNPRPGGSRTAPRCRRRLSDQRRVAPQESAHEHRGADRAIVSGLERDHGVRIELELVRRLHPPRARVSRRARARRAPALSASLAGAAGHGSIPGCPIIRAIAWAWSLSGKSDCSRQAICAAPTGPELARRAPAEQQQVRRRQVGLHELRHARLGVGRAVVVRLRSASCTAASA